MDMDPTKSDHVKWYLATQVLLAQFTLESPPRMTRLDDDDELGGTRPRPPLGRPRVPPSHRVRVGRSGALKRTGPRSERSGSTTWR